MDKHATRSLGTLFGVPVANRRTRANRRPTRRAVVRLLVSASLVLTSLSSLVLTPITAHAAWYNASYLLKKSVTIDHTKVGLPQFDAVSAVQDKLNQATPLAWNHTVGTGSNTLLIVTIAYAAAKATTGVTFNGVAMAQVTGSPKACSASCNAEMWYLKNPASGTHSVSVAFPAGTVSMIAGSSSYQDVNQTTPIGTVATASNTSANMSNANATTVGDQLIADGFAANANTFTVNAAQTLNYESHTNAHGGSSYRTSAGASTTMTWTNTSTVWAEIIAPINPADQANFPVLVKEPSDVNLMTVGNGGSVQNASGFDIIFTDSTETTKLDHEIEHYVPTTGEIEMWVRMPTLSASVDTVIYLYYDNASISVSQENKTGVWDANYQAVWHMADNATTTTVFDSTSTANGTNAGNTSTKTAAGQVAAGLSYNGTSDKSTISTNIPLANASFTVEAWAKDTAFTNPLAIIFGQSDVNGQDNALEFGYRTYNGHFTCSFNSDDLDSATTYTADGLWHLWTCTYTTSNKVRVMYKDGAFETSNTALANYHGSGNSYLGDSGAYAPTQMFTGAIDEVRVSTTPRTAGWIKTEYNDELSPSTFLTFGAAVGSVSLSVGSVPGPVLVQHNEAHSVGDVTTLPVSLPSPPALSDLLVVVGGGSVAATDTLAGPGGYTLAGSAGSRAGSSASIWYKVAVGGESATVSITGTSGSLAVAIQEWSGLAASTPLDQTANNIATVAGVTAPTGTTSATTVPSELVIAGMAVGNNAAGHVFSAWSAGYNTGPADVETIGATLQTGLDVASQVVAATGTQTATATWTTSGTPVGVIATFKPNTPIVAFPSITLDGTDKIVTQTVTFTVADTRGSGAGWTISGSGTQFSDGNGHTLPATATTVTSQPAWTCSGGCTLASSTCTTLNYTLPSGSATAMCTTGAGTGLNTMNGVVTFTIKVPGNQVGIGPYQSTWTFTIA